MATGLCNNIGAKRHAVRPVRNAQRSDKISVTAKHSLEKSHSFLSSLGGHRNRACLSIESMKEVVGSGYLGLGVEQQWKAREVLAGFQGKLREDGC